MALSPSGRRVALQRGEAFTTVVGTDIWMIDLMTGVLSRITSDPGFEGDPSWSPDERSLAFTTRRTGRLSLFKKDLSTGNEAPLAELAFDATLDEWTPDGRFIMFRNLGRAIQALPMVGERKPRIIVDTPLAIEDQVHVSPNGRWIAFNSNDPVGGRSMWPASRISSASARSRAMVASSPCGGATARSCSISIR
jgi:Tol biopolymer transport system component